MAKRTDGKTRTQGTIERRGNSYRVKVYSGIDPLTGKRVYLRESTTSEAEARRILTRRRAQVDEQRSAQTRGEFRMAIEEWLKVQELDDSTRESYEVYARNYIYPALGGEPVSKLSVRVLEQFYAELRRCRTRCNGQPFIEHRTLEPHESREVRHKRPPGRPPAGGYPEHV